MTEEEILAGIRSELNKRVNANSNEIAVQTPSFQSQENLTQLLTQLVDTARKQQLTADQATQSTLTQATTSLGNRQQLEQIFSELGELQKGISGQILAPSQVQNYLNQVEQIEGQLRQLIRKTDSQITQGLQQAVTALAQTQSAMLDASSYAQLEQMLAQLKQNLNQWKNLPPAGAPLQ
jgi:hypothetical protein